MRAIQTPVFKRIPRVVAVLLVALLLATQAFWVCIPVRAQGIDGPPYRFEGFIRVKNPDTWLIGTELDGYRAVSVSPQTVIVGKTGYAPEIGAWVIVFARYASNQWQASLIQVDRPAGAPGVPIQFTGSVTKQGDGRWKIGDLPIAVSPTTPGADAVNVGANVWVGATMAETGLRAESLRVLDKQPVVEFEGTLKEIGPGFWTIDDQHVVVTDATHYVGDPQPGMFVECRALTRNDGSLVAMELRVGPPASPTKKTGTIVQIRAETGDAATWSVLLDQSEPGELPTLSSVHVDGNTWVDQSRAVAAAGQWFRLSGAATGARSFQADLLRVEHGAQPTGGKVGEASRPLGLDASPWSSPTTIAARLNNAENSTLVFTGNGTAHAIWETDNRLYAAHQGLGEAWSTPQEIAYGFAPYMIAGADGALHVAFVNSFMGNFETYYVVWRGGTWSLPINMSHTDGYSAHPKLAFSPNGALHAVWMDNTPGYWTTYYATWQAPFWSTRPIPSGRGEAPSLAVAQDGTVHTVWQDRLSRDGAALGDYEVLLSGLRNGTWTPPLNVSDSRNVNSLGPDITTTADNLAHIVWVEDDELVRYSFGQASSWSAPTTIATAISYAKGVRIAAELGKILHVAWDEEHVVRATSAPERTQTWPESYVVVESDDLLGDVCITPNPAGGVGMTWSQAPENGKASINASRRVANLIQRLWIPLVLRR